MPRITTCHAIKPVSWASTLLSYCQHVSNRFVLLASALAQHDGYINYSQLSQSSFPAFFAQSDVNAIVNFFLSVLVDGKYIALCLAQCSRCERMQRRHTEGKMKPLTLLVASLASLCSGVPPAILCSCRHSHALNLFLKYTILRYIIFRCIHVFNQCCYQLWYNNHDSVSAYYTLNVVSVTS